MRKIIFCLFIISTFLCFSQDRLVMYHIDKITIPNDTIAYFKSNMSLVNRQLISSTIYLKGDVMSRKCWDYNGEEIVCEED